MTKVLLTREINQTYREKIKDLGYQVQLMEEGGPLEDIDLALGGLALRNLDFSQLKRLQAVFLTSMGVDYLPLDYFSKKGIILANNQGVYAETIGEFIVFNLLQLQKANRFFIQKQEAHLWEKPKTGLGTLKGKTILFFGTGSLAQAGARRLEAFGVQLLGYRKSPKPQTPFQEIVTDQNLDQALKRADFLVLTLPKTKETYHLINRDLLAKTKPGVKIINVARGDIIQEEALVDYLESGHVAGACLDVFEKEPLDPASPLWDMDQVYITPHHSYSSEGDRKIEYKTIMENLKRFKKNQPLIHVVDTDKGY